MRDGEHTIEESRPLDIKEYTSYLKHQCKRKPKTINKYIAALKVFFAFLFSEDVVKDNPMTHTKIETTAHAIGVNQTKWLTKEEQNRFISYVQLEPNEFKRMRNGTQVPSTTIYLQFKPSDLFSRFPYLPSATFG